MVTELITSAALSIQNPHYTKNRLIISAPPPARHYHLLHGSVNLTKGMNHEDIIQGFLTSTGRFVTREEGAKLVSTNGQETIDRPGKIYTMLFSEDLW